VLLKNFKTVAVCLLAHTHSTVLKKHPQNLAGHSLSEVTVLGPDPSVYSVLSSHRQLQCIQINSLQEVVFYSVLRTWCGMQYTIILSYANNQTYFYHFYLQYFLVYRYKHTFHTMS
jgi:hypothetical protein